MAFAQSICRDRSGTPLDPFGYGLSDSHFLTSNMQVAHSAPLTADVVPVSVDLTNESELAGDDVPER